ncbi:lanthionine synthetase LanC family protein [Cytophagaceae bacterium ABcell3]|nr:lanthionine synthetase LanC family protein [Cytophagaceae bacterium ABcell3]
MTQEELTIAKGVADIGYEHAYFILGDDNPGFWETVIFSGGYKREFEESIYNGNAGILLFYLELYNLNPDPVFLRVIRKSASFLLAHVRKNSPASFSFYTGRTGVLYVLLKASAYVTLPGLRKTVAAQLKFVQSADVQKNDLLLGKAGVILGLLKVYELMPRNYIIEIINKQVIDLLRETKWGRKGIYWDRFPMNIRGLCGFSHGVSGISYVLFMLARLTGNSAFVALAEEGFEYENSFFDQERCNWPDFRKGINEQNYEQFKTAFLNKETKIFTTPSFMNAWCHGAAGIGMSRIYASKLYGTYNKDLQSCLKTSEIDPDSYSFHNKSFTLCHGECGNALLFLEYHKAFGNKAYLGYARKIALKAIQEKKENGIYLGGYPGGNEKESPSLFLGAAGIGYYFLQCLNPGEVPSLMKPDADIPRFSSNNTNKKLQKILPIEALRNRYPATFKVLKNDDIFSLQKYLGNNHYKNFPDSFKIWFDKISNHKLLNAKKKDDLIHAMDCDRISDCWYLIKEDVEQKIAKTCLKPESLLHKQLILNGGNELVDQDYDPVTKMPNCLAENTFLLLRKTCEGIKELQVNVVQAIVMLLFIEAKKPSNILENVVTEMAESFGESRGTVQGLIHEILHDMYLSTILIDFEN